LVTRREDIVINRDPIQLPPDLEKGAERDTIPDSSTSGETKVTASQSIQEMGTTQGTESNDLVEGQSSRIIARDFRDQEPADGTDILSEWREGKYNVIERRNGAGEDVSLFVLMHDWASKKII
jgi:hypothetical protein